MIISGIDTKDISVVVQGAVKRGTIELCLNSIREYLPGAEIILSTWEGTNVEGLDYDHVLLNKDPGAFDIFNVDYSQKCNYERQQLSTINGIKETNKKYVVKMRTDFMLESACFLKYFGKYQSRNKDYSFFKEKVICCDLYSRNPLLINENLQYAVHPADFFFFGLREDMEDLFGDSQISEDDKIYFAKKYSDKKVTAISRFTPEQFLWISFLKKHIPRRDLPLDMTDNSSKAVRLTEATFASNLVILNNRSIGIKSLKNSIFQKINGMDNCYSHTDWKCLYSFYCEGKHVLYFLFRMKCVFKNTFLKLVRFAKRFLYSGYITLKNSKVIKGRVREIGKAIILRFKERRNHLSHYTKSFLAKNVTEKDLSVIVQEDITRNTSQCLKSIREVLPGAEIVLSTWENADISGLDYDVLVKSEDPGPDGILRRFPHFQYNNVNREIVSTYNGLCAANRYYVLKVHSDMIIQNAAFLTYYNQYSQYLSPNAVFDRRVMVDGAGASLDKCFEISNRWYLGAKHDLKLLFDIPRYPKETVPYFEEKGNIKKKVIGQGIVCRYTPERYIVYSWLKKNAPFWLKGRLNYDHYYAETYDMIQLTQEVIADNFMCLEYPKSGIIERKIIIKNPCVYQYGIPLTKWINLCKDRKTLPLRLTKQIEDKEYYKAGREYAKNPQYYTLLDCLRSTNGDKALRCCEYSSPSKIDKADITFVVTGLIIRNGEYNTHNCLTSIRRFFKDSKIILVTWKGQDVSEVKTLCDKVMIIEEPKEEKTEIFVEGFPVQKRNSINLQQFSVHTGMQQVSTKYAVRFRTDFCLFNDSFLSFYQEWCKVLNKYDPQYRLFDQRVLAYSFYTRDPRSQSRGYTYMLSDCFEFGLTSDLQILWDGHRESVKSFNYFVNDVHSKLNNQDGFRHQYTAEQYFLLNAIKKKKLKVQVPEYYNDIKDIYIFEYEKVMASNILIGDGNQLGIESKFKPYDLMEEELYSHEKLLEKYLYNIDSRNKACRAYLKNYFEKKSCRQGTTIHRVSVNSFIQKSKRKGRDGMKMVLRCILPAYRVNDAMRGETFNWWNHVEQRWNYLDDSIRSLQNEISSLKKLMDRNSKYEE